MLWFVLVMTTVMTVTVTVAMKMMKATKPKPVSTLDLPEANDGANVDMVAVVGQAASQPCRLCRRAAVDRTGHTWSHHPGADSAL